MTFPAGNDILRRTIGLDCFVQEESDDNTCPCPDYFISMFDERESPYILAAP